LANKSKKAAGPAILDTRKSTKSPTGKKKNIASAPLVGTRRSSRGRGVV
jgi:hypothetical protein